jgi:fluoride ion exporter CrcB/FEX
MESSTIARGIASIFLQTMQSSESGGCCVTEDDGVEYESPSRRMKRKGVKLEIAVATTKDQEDKEHPYDEIVTSPTDNTNESSYDEEDIEVARTGKKLSRTEADMLYPRTPDPPAAYPVTRQSSSSFRRRKRSRESPGSQDLPRPCGKGSEARQQQGDRHIYYILHISASAIIGSCSRVFLSRFFGEDCEDGGISDFLTPLSSQICVTAGGRTMQTGGALFRDLPADLLGSFIMGFITPQDAQKTSRLPWHEKDHPLQQDDVFHTSLGVGLCGCLTTFASWNTQMVVMLVSSA